MPITITCDKCDKRFEVDDVDAGKRASCPYCGDVNRVPAKRTVAGRSVGAAQAQDRAGSTQAIADEPVLAVVRQAMFRAHPLVYSLLVIGIVGGLLLAILASASFVAAPLAIPGLALAAVATIALIVWWLAPHRWTKLTITTRRTIRQEGIVMRKTSEVLHSNVTNVIIEQGLIGRLLDVGYLGLDTAGQGGLANAAGVRSSIEIEIWNVPKPYEVKKLIDGQRL